jgi:hypothetical protein
MRQANADVLSRLVSGLPFRADTTYVSREQAQQHEIVQGVPMQKISDALTEYRFDDPRDTAAFTGLLVTIAEAYRNDSSLTASVYKMRPKVTGQREINEDGTIEYYLQGRTDREGAYPGDTFFKQDGQLILQLHSYNLTQKKTVVAKAAPLLVAHVPEALARDWLVQVQRGQN